MVIKYIKKKKYFQFFITIIIKVKFIHHKFKFDHQYNVMKNKVILISNLLKFPLS